MCVGKCKMFNSSTMNKLFFQFILTPRVPHKLLEVRELCWPYTHQHSNSIKHLPGGLDWDGPEPGQVFGSLPPTPQQESHNGALLTREHRVFYDKCCIIVPSGLHYSTSLKNVTIICLHDALLAPLPPSYLPSSDLYVASVACWVSPVFLIMFSSVFF